MKNVFCDFLIIHIKNSSSIIIKLSKILPKLTSKLSNQNSGFSGCKSNGCKIRNLKAV